MIVCDCCKDVKKANVARYIIEAIPLYEHNDFRIKEITEFPDRKYASVDLCSPCYEKVLKPFMCILTVAIRRGGDVDIRMHELPKNPREGRIIEASAESRLKVPDLAVIDPL